MSPVNQQNDRQNTSAILVVDDNQQNLELLQAYLEDIDCETIPANDGLEALDIIANNPPDLVLLDPPNC
jgi:CheY-like chemotaxis protein